MRTNPKRYVLADVSAVQDKATGDRVKRVTKAKALVNVVDLVGVNTAQMGQVQGFTLSYSVEIRRVFYKNEKFLYFDGRLYEVKTITKAKNPVNMLLNVQALDDPEVSTAIKEWINENLR